MRIGIVPLDSRPATAIFPQRIAAIAGIETLLPPPAMLGMFLQPGDTQALARWLLEVAPDVDALLLAADMLAYGGLVASRSPAQSLTDALASLAILERLHERFPHVPLLVASVIMRISITASDASVVQHYHNLIRYSELHYMVEQDGRDDLRADLAAVAAQIPPTILQNYLAARHRNHTVNRHLVNAWSRGVLAGLILIQEDASSVGPHLIEHEILRSLAAEHGITDLPLYPGADEGVQTLLARQINAHAGLRVDLRYTSDWGAATVAPFEDRPLRATTEQHLAAAGVVVDATAPIVFWTHTPATSEELSAAVATIGALIAAGRHVAVADVAQPNGSDPALMAALRDAGILPHLVAYAGWNTAGNTLGTIIAHVSAWHAANTVGWTPEQRMAQTVFLWERYVDDWGYQSFVRQIAQDAVLARGEDPWQLGAAWERAEADVRERLSAWAQSLWQTGGWAGPPPTLAIRLPWRRMFEVEVTAVLDSAYAAGSSLAE